MFGKSGLMASFLAVALMAIPKGSATAQAIPQLQGVWDCQIIRAGNLSKRPLLYTFHSDGTATYSSQTNISNLGFTSRGGGYGEVQKAGPADYHVMAVENLYKDGNAGGRFLVDTYYHLNSKGNNLCSGSLPGDPCPTNGNVRVTQFQFPDASNACNQDSPLNIDDPICGEVDLFNPPVINVVARCDRLDTLTTYGSSVPVFPIPNPTP
jgi:hypothetical protein